MTSEKCENRDAQFDEIHKAWEALADRLSVPDRIRLEAEKLFAGGNAKDLIEVFMITARAMRKTDSASSAAEFYYRAWELDCTKEEAIWFVVRNAETKTRQHYAKIIAETTKRKVPGSRAALIAEAVQAEAKGNRQAMIAILGEAVRTHPNQMVYLQLIACLRAEGETAKAIVKCDQGIQEFPESKRIEAARSELLSKGFDPELVATSWEKLGNTNTKLKPLATINEARVYQESGAHDHAIAKYENYLDENGPTPECVEALVKLHCIQKNFDLAHSIVDRGKNKLAPDHRIALLGHIEIKSGNDYQEWQNFLLESLRSYPDSLEIYNCLFENSHSSKEIIFYLDRIVKTLNGNTRAEVKYVKDFIKVYDIEVKKVNRKWLNEINFDEEFSRILKVESASVLIAAFIRFKHFDRASAQLAASLLSHPEDPRLLHLQALLLFKTGNLEKADEIWKILEINPQFWKRAVEFRAKISLAQDDRTSASRHYEALWNRYPENDEASIFLLRYRLSLGRISEATEIQARIERIRKGQPVVWRSRAILALHKDGEDAALKILSEGTIKFPEQIDFRILLIDVARNANKLLDALSYALSAIEQIPDERRILIRALDLLQLCGQFNQQRELIDKFCSHSDNTPDLFLRRARVSINLGDRVGAIHDAEQGLLLAPRNIELWQLKIAALLNQNDPRSAQKECQRAIDCFGMETESDLVARAELFYSAERYEDAAKSAVTVLEANESVRRAHIIAAMAYEALGNWKASMGYYSKMLEYSDERKQIAATIARLSFALAYSDSKTARARAENLVAETVELTPTKLYPEVLFESACQQHLADIYKCSGSSVLHVTSSLGPGGAERQLTSTALAQNSSASKYSPSIAATSLSVVGERNFYVQRCESENILVCELDNVFASGAARNLIAQFPEHANNLQFLASLPIDAARLAIPLYCEIIEKRPTVLHLWQDTTCTVGGLVGLLAGVPAMVLSTRSTRPIERQRFRRYLKPAFLELLKKDNVAMVNNSANGANDYSAWLGIDLHAVSIVYNGYDFESMKQRAGTVGAADTRFAIGISTNDFVLGGVMRLSSEKRPTLWLDAAVKLVQARENCVAVLVGDGPMRNRLAKMIEDLGLNHRIKLLGTKNPVEPWIAMMDTLLLTSETEGLPNVLIEAQALGTPVVSVDVGGARETLDEGKTGMLVDGVSSGSEIAEKIGILIEDNQMRHTMGHNGAKMVAEKFSMNRTVECFEHIYDTLIRRSE